MYRTHDASGSWELPDELRMLRDTVRRFMAAEVRPAEAKLPHDAYTLEPDRLQRSAAQGARQRPVVFETPAEHGGAGLSLLGQCVVAEETAKCRMGMYIAGCGAFGFDPPNVIWKGTAAPAAVRARGRRERHQDLRRDQRAERRLRPGPRDPDARRAQGRSLRPQRHQDLDLGRRHGQVGRRVRAHRRQQGPRRHHQLHRREERARASACRRSR